MSDIFATEETQPADEAQAATSVDVQPEAAASAPATKPAARKASVEDSNGKVVVTLKGGKGTRPRGLYCTATPSLRLMVSCQTMV